MGLLLRVRSHPDHVEDQDFPGDPHSTPDNKKPENVPYVTIDSRWDTCQLKIWVSMRIRSFDSPFFIVASSGPGQGALETRLSPDMGVIPESRPIGPWIATRPVAKTDGLEKHCTTVRVLTITSN